MTTKTNIGKNSTAITGILSIQIDAKRWFQRSYGNTYHTVQVSIQTKDGWNVLATTPKMVYGYGDHYLHTAGMLLIQHGAVDFDNNRKSSESVAYDVVRLLTDSKVVTTHSVEDVKLMRDLQF